MCTIRSLLFNYFLQLPLCKVAVGKGKGSLHWAIGPILNTRFHLFLNWKCLLPLSWWENSNSSFSSFFFSFLFKLQTVWNKDCHLLCVWTVAPVMESLNILGGYLEHKSQLCIGQREEKVLFNFAYPQICKIKQIAKQNQRKPSSARTKQ